MIRFAHASDLVAIAAIYDHEVLTSTATMDTVPRTDAEHREWLEAHPESQYPVLVWDEGGAICGWASLTAFSPRRGYDRSAEVSVYVDQPHRGRGIGDGLLAALVPLAAQVGLRHLVARIESTGERSQRLHARHGFVPVGTLHQCAEKFGRILDVVLMERLLALPGTQTNA